MSGHFLLGEDGDRVPITGPDGFVDELDQPRSPSLADVLEKLQEIEEKVDALGRDVTNIEQSISNGVCGYGSYD